ncbi:hypothetical protein K438DRAFT_2075080 [Mycena galopus ATCC 62051]|nr:hypothetical protein K438DRAFT_2075080 [Mycena galopus ATCC 62051]
MSRVPDFANRGKCLNSVCGSGCTFFIPAPGPLPAHPGLVKCIVCPAGCCAAQHADLGTPVPAQTSAPQAVPPPTAAPPPSATFSTMQGSRSAAAPPKGPAGPNPFRAHAQKRQADVEARLADAGKTTGENTSPKKFHPAHTSQLEADLNPLDSTNKKRKRKNTKPGSGLPKATRKDLKEYTVVMVEDTKAVVADKYEKPNVNKLRALNEQGYVQAVNLHGQNTAEDITAAVSAVLLPTVPQINTYGFRVLEVHAVNIPTRNGRTSKKHSFLLRPIGLALGIAPWKRAHSQATIRDAGPGYKNSIFIALSPEAPNLPLPGVEAGAGVADPNLSSSTDSESDSEESSRSKPRKADRNNTENGTQPKDSAVQSQSESDSETESNVNNSEPARKKEKTATPDFRQAGLGVAMLLAPPCLGVHRPLRTSAGLAGCRSRSRLNAVNQDYSEFRTNDMDEPPFDFGDSNHPPLHPIPASHLKLWRTTPLPYLAQFNLYEPLLVDIIESTVSGQIKIDAFFEKITKYILIPLEPIKNLAANTIEAAGEADFLEEFDCLFGVGPGGISIVLPAFDLVYEGLARIHLQSFEMDATSIKTQWELESWSDNLLTCLIHFRTTCNRSLWDPKGGFRELAAVLHKADHNLPAGDQNHVMHKPLDLIDLKLDSESSLRYSLTEAFGSVIEPRQMNHEVVVGGKYGLLRFYAIIVEPLLDSLDRPEYDTIYALLNDCCRALARKCVNYLKTKEGRGPKANPPNPDSETAGPRTRAQARSASILRNAKSGYFKRHHPETGHFPYVRELYSDSPDDMTGTESAAEDWYHEYNFRPGPGIKTRSSDDEEYNPRPKPNAEYVPSSGSEDEYEPRPNAKTRPRPKWVDVETPPPSPRPKAQPQTQHEKDLADAEALRTLGLSWSALCAKILKHFPHPDERRRTQLISRLKPGTTAVDPLRAFSMAYHPDTNRQASQEWQAVSGLVMRAITDCKK